MERTCVLMTVADISTETTTEDVVTLPADGGGKLVRAEMFIDTANCTGAGAALSAVFQTGADGEESTKITFTGHATNDQQEIVGTIPATTAANYAGGTRLRFAVTAAGGDTSVATGCRLRLFFDRPKNPS